MTNADTGCAVPGRMGWRHGRRAGAMLVALGLMTGCSLDGLLNSDELPPDVSDPAITQTADGARAVYNATLAKFGTAFGGLTGEDGRSSFAAVTGVFTDELLRPGTVDRREILQGDESFEPTYSSLQKVRGQAGQAIAMLAKFLPDQAVLAGHGYALQGYTEIFLAELFCSGVPLSTLDYDGDFTYRPGSTTDAIFTHAATLFDTALTLLGDSARIMDLARVGRARALLAMGAFAEAAAAVEEVADGYRYNVGYRVNVGAFSTSFADARSNAGIWTFAVSDREGTNGLDYRTSGDPRTTVTSQGTFIGSSAVIYHPNKYATNGTTPIVLASGIEARLIEAEAALQAGDVATWLGKLNHLRQTAWPSIVPAIAGPLPDTTDPGTPEGRVDLLFRERAFWLFLTGHRQGDLRRLIRQYGRQASDLYPVGTYPIVQGVFAGVQLSYGSDITAPIPAAERANPLYTGCLSRDA